MATTTGAAGPAAAPRSRQAWNFARHFVEMCVAMCIGVAVANLMIAAAGTITGGDVREQIPGLATATLAGFITLPMVAWMRFRGMAWRPILEMCAAGIAVVIGAVALGLVSASVVSVATLCGLECVGMFVAMLFRYDLYSDRTGHQMGRAMSATGTAGEPKRHAGRRRGRGDLTS
jgi:hypothetical protein